MGQLCSRLLFLLLFIFPASHSFSQTINEANVHCNHAESYYWLSRNRLNSLHEVVVAKRHLDTAKQVLSSLTSNSQNKFNLLKDIQTLHSELDMLTTISEGNLNGQYPMYMHLTGQNDRQLEFRDDPLETSIENALEKLLESITFKPSKPLNELLTFSFIKIRDKSPEQKLSKERTAEIKEVIRQYLNNNAKFYVANDKEEAIVFGDNIKIGDSSLSRFKKEFESNTLGIITINLFDYTGSLKYCGAQFDYYNAKNGQIISSTYVEDFKEDKTAILSDFLSFGIWLLLCPFLLFSALILWLYYKNDAIQKFKNRWKYNLISIVVGIPLGSITGALFIFILSLIALPGDAFLGDHMSRIWPWLFAFGLMTLLPSMLLLLHTIVLNKSIVKDRFSTFLFLFSIGSGIFLILGFKYFEFFEKTPPLQIILLSYVLLGVSAHFQSDYFRAYYRAQKNILYVLTPLFFGLISLPIGSLFLYTSINSPIHINIGWEIFFIGFAIVIFKAFEFYIRKDKQTNQDDIKYGLDVLLKRINTQLSDYADNKIFAPFTKTVFDVLSSIIYAKNHDLEVIHLKGTAGIGKTALIESLLNDKALNQAKDTYWYYGDCDEFTEGKALPYEPFYQAFSEHIGQGVFYSGNESALAVLKGASTVLSVTPLSDLSDSLDSEKIQTHAMPFEVINEISDYLKEFIKEHRKINKANNESGQTIIFVLDDIQWMDLETNETLQLFIKEFKKLCAENDVYGKLVLIETENPFANTENKNLASFFELIYELKKKNVLNLTIWDNKENKVSGFKFNEIYNEKFLYSFLTKENIKFIFDQASLKQIYDYATQNEVNSSRNLLEIIKYLLENGQLVLEDQMIVLKESSALNNIPLSTNEDLLLYSIFESIDAKLLKILCSGSFVGQQFEANVLSQLWNIDRLNLLHALLEAEKKGIIIDLNDTDDYYAFTSKQVRRALQSYALNDTKNTNRIPQIVLEYHRKIIYLTLQITEISIDIYPELLRQDSDILMKMGYRAKHLSNSLEREILYAVCCEKLNLEGNYAQAYYFASKIIQNHKFLYSKCPNLFEIKCALIIRNTDKDKEKDKTVLIKLYEILYERLFEKKTALTDIGSNSLLLFHFCQLNTKLLKFDFNQSFDLPKELEAIARFYKLLNEKDKVFTKTQENEIQELNSVINFESEIHPRVVGAYLNSLSNLTVLKDQLNKRELFLKQRFSTILNQAEIIEDSLFSAFLKINLLALSFQQLEDLAYFSSSLLMLLQDQNENDVEIQNVAEKRIVINKLINDEFGSYKGRLEYLNIVCLSINSIDDKKKILGEYINLIYDYPETKYLINIFPRLVQLFQSISADYENEEEIEKTAAFVKRIILKVPKDKDMWQDSSIDIKALNKSSKIKLVKEALDLM